MQLTDVLGNEDDDGIEERSVHSDGLGEFDAGGYELPPPMTESEIDDNGTGLDDGDDIPILAASDYGEAEQLQGTPSLSCLPPASMYIKQLEL